MNINSIPEILAGVRIAACPPAMWGEERVPAVAPAMAAHALKLIGLDKAGVVVDAIELKREDHFLPFGPEHDTILRIHVSHFNFGERDGKEIHANPYIHGLNIYYSEALGQVVKIISDLPKGVKVQQPFPPVMAQEKALKQQKEIYTWSALPAPRVKLIEALESADR
ncbi:MAG TPA: hypothetical protein VG733_01115, partial [Chthoniobacteraceae bacterium]|nr:hypothetical protein [Chthoniobacteraceae bacterium]